MQPVVIVHNPVSGSGRAARLAARTGVALEALGIPVRQEPTAAQGDGTAIASRWEGRCRALLAVGGDGTLREVLQGLSQATTPLGTLPAGTSNLLARSFGLRPDPVQVARMIARGRTRNLDLLGIEGEEGPPRTGLLFVGAGFDGTVVADVAGRRARRIAAGQPGHLTWGSYLLPGLRALLSWRPPDLTLFLDGSLLPGGPWGWVLLANLGSYAYGIRLGDQVAPDDGLLDLFALPARSRFAFLRFFLAAHLGIIERMADLTHIQTSCCVEIAGTPGVPVQIDGDPGGSTPISVRLKRSRASLLVPT